jgi:hypothetical protein
LKKGPLAGEKTIVLDTTKLNVPRQEPSDD